MLGDFTKHNFGTRWRIKLVKQLLNIQSNDTVLDAGCADGYISFKVSQRSQKVVGVDWDKT